MARRTEAGGRLITPKKLPPAFVVPLSGSFQPHFDGFVFKRAQSLKTCLYLRLPQKSLGSFCIFFSPRSGLPRPVRPTLGRLRTFKNFCKPSHFHVAHPLDPVRAC